MAFYFPINPPDPNGSKKESSLEIHTLHIDNDELKLIKIGLFEVSEYLDSPKLRELRQRVNAISNSIKPKLPADSIFNKGPFAQAAAEFREAAAYMKSTALSKEPK